MTAKDTDAANPTPGVAIGETALDRRGFITLGAGGLLGTVLTDARPAAAQSAAAARHTGHRARHQRPDLARSRPGLPIFQPAADPCRL